jgi:ATP-binding protein involved in chromosome partitioning
MLLKALQQLLHEVSWGGLDVLVLDLPPGTGDTQLSVAQQIHLDGKHPSFHFPNPAFSMPLLHQPYFPQSSFPSSRLTRLLGSLIITTPHTLSLADATRGLAMWEKVSVPVLGLVQNMSVFTCPCCGKPSHVFGTGEKVKALCESKGIDILADVPLHPRIAEDAQDGRPTVAADPKGEGAGVFMDLARKVGGLVGL